MKGGINQTVYKNAFHSLQFYTLHGYDRIAYRNIANDHTC